MAANATDRCLQGYHVLPELSIDRESISYRS